MAWRYLITVDQTGEVGTGGPMVAHPSGKGALMLPDLDEAREIAQALVKEGAVKAAYVQALTPVVAFIDDKELGVTTRSTEETGGLAN